MRNGPNKTFSLEGDSVSLVCGYQLRSNPQANITWKHPDGSTVESSDRIIRDNGTELVQLNLTNTSARDGGNWNCIVEVIHTCVWEQDKSCSVRNNSLRYKMELVVIGELYKSTDHTQTELLH
jgi:hypothetical protein